jgi:flagellar FliL protein
MADEPKDKNPEEGLADTEEEQADAGKSRKGGNGFLVKILKFVAIGIAAVIFIVTVTVVTYMIMSKGGKSQTAVPVTASYEGIKPVYAVFSLIGTITTQTRDETPHMVTVDMLIEYDMNDNAGLTELTGRQYQLRDFTRRFFSGKYAAELSPENESRIKQEIRELLNTTILEHARARGILFNKLQVADMG